MLKGLTIDEELMVKVIKEGQKENRKFSDQVCYILKKFFQEKEEARENNHNQEKKS